MSITGSDANGKERKCINSPKENPGANTISISLLLKMGKVYFCIVLTNVDLNGRMLYDG